MSMNQGGNLIYFAKWMCHTGYANISLPIMICDSYHAFNKCSKCGKPIQFMRCQYTYIKGIQTLYTTMRNRNRNREPVPDQIRNRGTGS